MQWAKSTLMRPAISVGSKFQGTWTSSGISYCSRDHEILKRDRALDVYAQPLVAQEVGARHTSHETSAAQNATRDEEHHFQLHATPDVLFALHLFRGSLLKPASNAGAQRARDVARRGTLPAIRGASAPHSCLPCMLPVRRREQVRTLQVRRQEMAQGRRRGSHWQVLPPGCERGHQTQEVHDTDKERTCDPSTNISYVAKEKKGTEGFRGRRLQESRYRNLLWQGRIR